MIDKASSLEDILAHVWQMLADGSQDKQHPYRYPALATYGSNGIQQRTVVLREADATQRTLVCYSDLRTQKVTDLSLHPEASWLFYDQESQEQIRVSTDMDIHHQDRQAEAAWHKIPPKGRADYIGPHPPGTSSQHYIDNLPESFLQDPTEENTAEGIANFCILKASIKSIDYLRLMKKGHIRASFIWQQGAWTTHWVAP